MLGFSEQEDPDVVYRDGLTDGVYLESPDEVAQYTRAFDNLQAIASSPARSTAVIKEVLEECSP